MHLKYGMKLFHFILTKLRDKIVFLVFMQIVASVWHTIAVCLYTALFLFIIFFLMSGY